VLSFTRLPENSVLGNGEHLEALLAHSQEDGDKPDTARTPHLLCGSKFWSLSSSLGCVYLAWLAFARIRSQQFEWPNDIWSILAYGVWVAFLLVLMTETRCFRERLLFALLIANFALALWMAAAPNLHPTTAQTARQISLALWVLGALYSASFIFRRVPVADGGARKV
jgi:hypothetical protein